VLEEEGIVERIDGDTAVIVTVRKAECEGCVSRGACEMMGQGKEVRAKVLNPVGAKPGQRVKVVVPERILLKSTFMIYFIPTLLLMAGASAGYLYSLFSDINPDLSSIIGGGVGIAVSFFLIVVLNRSLKNKRIYWPTIKEIIAQEGEELVR